MDNSPVHIILIQGYKYWITILTRIHSILGKVYAALQITVDPLIVSIDKIDLAITTIVKVFHPKWNLGRTKGLIYGNTNHNQPLLYYNHYSLMI